MKRICKRCEKEFHEKKSRIKEGKGKYCSLRCYWGKRIEKSCKFCNKRFEVPKCLDRVESCSRSCARKALRGKDNPLWKGGSTIHKKVRGRHEWKEWRESVFSRDNYECKLCGGGGELHPHHIKGVTFFENLAYDTDNGITVCKSCHYLIHSSNQLKQAGWNFGKEAM